MPLEVLQALPRRDGPVELPEQQLRPRRREARPPHARAVLLVEVELERTRRRPPRDRNEMQHSFRALAGERDKPE